MKQQEIVNWMLYEDNEWWQHVVRKDFKKKVFNFVVCTVAVVATSLIAWLFLIAFFNAFCRIGVEC